jgi:hypothetical protein
MRFSPRLDPAVVEAVRRMDVEHRSVADMWREAGGMAVRLGLARPGYHSILGLVLEERRRRAERREAILQAVDELWSYTGTDYETLVRRLVDTRRSPE